MAAVRTSLRADDLPGDLGPLRSAVEARIPVGFAAHSEPTIDEMPDPLRREVRRLLGRFRDLHVKVHDLSGKAAQQLGTLGGGNHFIELCLDTDQSVWLMLHSGSRNIGKTLAELHMQRAKRLGHNAHLPDPDLAVFLAGTEEMAEYRHDLYWAQEYARLNREVMLTLYEQVLERAFPGVRFEGRVSCHHNYVAEEVHFGEKLFVTRKGAIRAGRGEMGLIPGSMGTKSYVVSGLGHPESYESASHGAGRRMSRARAKKRFNLNDLRRATEGVECRKDAGVLDEIPAAYKDIDRVMENQKDLVEVVAELKQIMCVKG
jgi:tRNA-splicing ligase RtcB